MLIEFLKVSRFTHVGSVFVVYKVAKKVAKNRGMNYTRKAASARSFTTSAPPFPSGGVGLVGGEGPG